MLSNKIAKVHITLNTDMRYIDFYKQVKAQKSKVGIKHVSNSIFTIELKEYYFDTARLWIIVYEHYPFNKIKNKIRPVLTLKSNVVHLKEVGEGTYISYEKSYITDSTRFNTKHCLQKYADGCTRALSRETKVIINGTLVPIVGEICID